jgi:hypothetical protein
MWYIHQPGATEWLCWAMESEPKFVHFRAAA